jgi:hypothetical protein
MPTSSSYLLSPVISFMGWLNPQSVLDVGCGYGQWGVLLRQHLDHPWELHAGIPRWNRRIDGVEVWEPYRNPLWDFAYSTVVVKDATSFLSGVDSDTYELALCAEVLEHMEAQKGRKLLDHLRRVSRHVLITTPDRPLLQGEVCGNPYESHHAWWSWAALKEAGAVGRLPASGATVALFSKSPETLESWQRGIRLRALGPIVPAPARAAAQRILYHLGRHPGPPSSGIGPAVERAH